MQRSLKTRHVRLSAFAILFACFCHSVFAQTPAAPDPSLDELRRGDSAYAAGNFPKALEAYENAGRLGRDACVPCLLRVSLTYVSMKKWRAALDTAGNALTLSSTDHQRSEAHDLKGRAYLGQIAGDPKMLPLAEEEFRAATQADPSAAVSHFGLGLVLLKQAKDAEGVPELQKFVDLAPQDSQASLAKEWIAVPARSRGSYAPDFHMTTSKGEEISLSSLQGKIAVLDFWATWCPPCRAALPDLKDLVKKYPPDRFELISVSIDKDADAWSEYVEKRKMTWSQFHDNKAQLFHTFGLHAVPTYIIIAGDGSIIDRVEGTDPQQSIAYRLKDILAKRPELKSQ